ncbi:hypothetical protein JI664_23345 [Rhodobacter sp. NTK016B]|uniref:hypothetical protein n=1 Tax=Rhodobacter sp. NTK016B TaxID=2759676 RepID=UPI001A8C1B3F|nr:hypothetical protein [Rhodobacter sp. NTK016B]MBN8294926.1 hypothetical protein [Rhodobacter sp. NTK016B]
MDGIESIAAERKRQVEGEGWTPEHDDEHAEGELGKAAACYALAASAETQLRFDIKRGDAAPQDWPWDTSWWKPKDRRADLVRAGALIAAEIDRLDRAEKARNHAACPPAPRATPPRAGLTQRDEALRRR